MSVEVDQIVVHVSNGNKSIRLTDDLSVESTPTDVMRMTGGKERYQFHHSSAPSFPNISVAYCMKNDGKKRVIHYEHALGDTNLEERVESERNDEARWLFETDKYGFHHLTGAGRRVLKDVLQGAVDLNAQGHTHDNLQNLKNIIIKRDDGYSKLKNVSNKKKGAADLRGFADVVNSLLEVKDDKLLEQLKFHLRDILATYDKNLKTNTTKAKKFLRESLKFLRKNHSVFKKNAGKLNFLLEMHRKKRYSDAYFRGVKIMVLVNHPDVILRTAIPDDLFKNSYDDKEKMRWNPDDSSKWKNFSIMDVFDYFRNRVEHINDKAYHNGKKVGKKELYCRIHSLEPYLIGELYNLAYKEKFDLIK